VVAGNASPGRNRMCEGPHVTEQDVHWVTSCRESPLDETQHETPQAFELFLEHVFFFISAYFYMYMSVQIFLFNTFGTSGIGRRRLM
jgi:hypothetical protein